VCYFAYVLCMWWKLCCYIPNLIINSQSHRFIPTTWPYNTLVQFLLDGSEVIWALVKIYFGIVQSTFVYVWIFVLFRLCLNICVISFMYEYLCYFVYVWIFVLFHLCKNICVIHLCMNICVISFMYEYLCHFIYVWMFVLFCLCMNNCVILSMYE